MYHIIINPIAGKGKAAKQLEIVKRCFDQAHAPYRIHRTNAIGSARAISSRLTTAGERDIIAMGGDGTANEVLNGFSAPEKVRFGLIPSGSGNDFAAAAKIPSDPEAAAALILKNAPKKTDYLTCGRVRGLNVIGTGIDVDILRRSYRAKHLRGSMNYFVSLLSSVAHYAPGPMTARFNETCEEGSAFILCACNGRQIGGGIGICPCADVGDGQLDVVLVRGLARHSVPGALIKLMQKKILEQPYTIHALSDRVRAEFAQATTIQVDGELYDDLPFDVAVVPGGSLMHRP